MLSEVLEVLSPLPGQTYLDCTAGLGGHAAAVAERVGPRGTIVLMDLDPGNLARAKARIESLPSAPRVHAIHASFAECPHRLGQLGLRVDCVLADLGFASSQVDDPARGLSFMRDGPLDMRLDPTRGPSAADLVASLSVMDLTRIIREYGEERHAHAVAHKIVQARSEAPIRTTAQLAELIRSVVRRSPDGIDPATRTFQALRIATNDEIGSLEAFLAGVRSAAGLGPPPRTAWLNPGARIAVISFHSLEDRPVKHAFAELFKAAKATDLTSGARRPGETEERTNPRARSAKLRAAALPA